MKVIVWAFTPIVALFSATTLIAPPAEIVAPLCTSVCTVPEILPTTTPTDVGFCGITEAIVMIGSTAVSEAADASWTVPVACRLAFCCRVTVAVAVAPT